MTDPDVGLRTSMSLASLDGLSVFQRQPSHDQQKPLNDALGGLGYDYVSPFAAS